MQPLPREHQGRRGRRVLREGYGVSLLNDGFYQLVDVLGLEVLMIDTHRG